nr:hypothetical protein CFP56_50431 [Quercus suber]
MSAESQLTTHDISIPLVGIPSQPARATASPRTLRLLLLSPRSTSEANLSATLERIRHFTPLTGGQDLALILLLSTPPALSFVSARTLTTAALDNTTDNTRAYATLQCALLAPDVDIPMLPLLPLATLSGLPGLLQDHVRVLSGRANLVSPRRPVRTPRDLLALCSTSTNPPVMAQRTAYLVMDLFPDLASLADACAGSAGWEESESADVGWRCMDFSSPSKTDRVQADGARQLARLRDLVGEQEWTEIVKWWKAEWAVD